jgi:hypothetical protein
MQKKSKIIKVKSSINLRITKEFKRIYKEGKNIQYQLIKLTNKNIFLLHISEEPVKLFALTPTKLPNKCVFTLLIKLDLILTLQYNIKLPT